MHESGETEAIDDTRAAIVRLALAEAPRLEASQAPAGCVAFLGRTIRSLGLDAAEVGAWLTRAGGYATYGYVPSKPHRADWGMPRPPLQPEQIYVVPSAALCPPAPA